MELNGAIFFMGLCLFSPMLISIFLSAIDKLEKPSPVQVVKIEYVDRIIYKDKPNIKQESKAEIESPVKLECIECLISLGMKKVVAKDKVNKMWADKNYNSVESFLMDAYKV